MCVSQPHSVHLTIPTCVPPTVSVPLQSCFSQKSWQGRVCGREICVTCSQGGEELPDSTRASSVVYESLCTQCNPSAGRTVLNRWIREAVRIHRRGGASSILNSKAEFNWCYNPRLVVEKEDEGAKERRQHQEEQETKERVWKQKTNLIRQWGGGL